MSISYVDPTYGYTITEKAIANGMNQMSAQIDNVQNVVLQNIAVLSTNISNSMNSNITASNNLSNVVKNGFDALINTLINNVNNGSSEAMFYIEETIADLKALIESNQAFVQNYIDAANVSLEAEYQNAMDEFETNITEFQSLYTSMIEQNTVDTSNNMAYYSTLFGIETSKSIEVMQGTFASVNDLVNTNTKTTLEGVANITNPVAITIGDLNDKLDNLGKSFTSLDPASLQNDILSYVDMFKGIASKIVRSEV